MAISRNPYAQYQNSKVLTASPSELTLMLYDGVIKFINIAIAGVEEKDYEKVNLNAKKAQRIIDHLNETLINMRSQRIFAIFTSALQRLYCRAISTRMPQNLNRHLNTQRVSGILGNRSCKAQSEEMQIEK